MTQFLTGHGLVLVHALEVGDPGIEYLLCFTDVNEEGAPPLGDCILTGKGKLIHTEHKKVKYTP